MSDETLGQKTLFPQETNLYEKKYTLTFRVLENERGKAEKEMDGFIEALELEVANWSYVPDADWFDTTPHKMKNVAKVFLHSPNGEWVDREGKEVEY